MLLLLVLQEARIHRASIIQHFATCMANLKELAQDMNVYWQQLQEQLGEDAAEARMTRFREVQVSGREVQVSGREVQVRRREGQGL